ncbi:MAG: HK97 family phage prohead protease [Xanthomonadaceae bacterium]|nr:HK97 family phage prohead protease [Xanthomonadaceae bacterium]
MHPNLSSDDIEAGLAYCRWLHNRAFCDWMAKAAPSLPRRAPPVLLNDRGKRVYAIAKSWIPDLPMGATRLSEGERQEVVKLLCELRERKKAPNAGRRDPAIKHATLRLNGITKFMSGGKRTIRGLANSGLTDRMGDIVEPKGGRWTLPIPLLWQHKHDQPIGWVRQIDAKSDGLWITAELAEGIGKADEAWRAIESGLVDSYSIGFQADDWSPLPTGGKRFTSWTLLEVSVVTIPADPAAKIRRGMSSIDRAVQIAKGA